MSKNVAEYFACDVFNDEVMKARLPKAVYKALTKTRKLGVPLDPTYADVVANALKDWAIEHGATHYTHWFQPMTGSTAEKHDSFITPTDGAMWKTSCLRRRCTASPCLHSVCRTGFHRWNNLLTLFFSLCGL